MAGDAATSTQGQADAQSGEQGQGGPDIGSLAEQLSTMGAGLEEMRSFLQTQPWQAQADDGQQQQQSGEPEGDPFDLSFLDPEAPGFDPEQIASSLSQIVDRAVDQRVNTAFREHVSPLAEGQAEMRREREAEALVQEFPALGDTDTAQQLVHVAQQVATAYGHPDIGAEPWFWRTIYLAGQAAEMSSEEGTAPNPAVLEGGGGAMPGAFEGNMADAIVGAKGRGVLPF